MGFSRRRDRSHLWLTAAFTVALTATTQLAAQDAPRVEPDQITIAAEVGKVSFSMFGSDVGLFKEIRLVSEDERSEIEGIIVAMGRARGERRNASIRTSGATPGIYSVELVDSRGNAVTLDLEVIVEGDEEADELSVPEVNKDLIEIPADAGRVSFSMLGPQVGLFKAIQLVADDERSDTEGIRIAMGRARGEKRNASIRTSGATPGLYFVELLDGHGDAVRLEMEVIVEGDEEAEELSTPEVSKDLIEIPPSAGRVSFSMLGPQVGLFKAIQLVADDERSETEGIRIAMGRARGEKRNASIRTSGATPGLYFVELLDDRGDAVRLEMEVIVEGDEEIEEVEEPSTSDGNQAGQQAAEIESAPGGPVVVQILSLTDDPLPVTDIELGGVDIEVVEATTGDHSDYREYTYGATEYRDITLTILHSPPVQPLLDWANEAIIQGLDNVSRRDIVFTFGDRDGVPGVQYNANGSVPVSVDMDGAEAGGSQSISFTLRPQMVEPTMSSDIGPGEFTLPSAESGGARFDIEIDVDGRNVKLAMARFAGGELVVEESEASSGSSQHNESTMGHNSVNELVIEVPSGLDEGILGELMHRVASQGDDLSAEIRIVALARTDP